MRQYKTPICFIYPTHTLMAYTVLMDPHPSQQHSGFQYAVWQPQQEVTKSNARFKGLTLFDKKKIFSRLLGSTLMIFALEGCLRYTASIGNIILSNFEIFGSVRSLLDSFWRNKILLLFQISIYFIFDWIRPRWHLWW